MIFAEHIEAESFDHVKQIKRERRKGRSLKLWFEAQRDCWAEGASITVECEHPLPVQHFRYQCLSSSKSTI